MTIASLNRLVLSRRLKWFKSLPLRISQRRLFHSLGAARVRLYLGAGRLMLYTIESSDWNEFQSRMVPKPFVWSKKSILSYYSTLSMAVLSRQALSRLTIVKVPTSLSDFKMIRIFTGKIKWRENSHCNNKHNKKSTPVVFPIWNCQLA